jgi:hypothetical protein
MYPVTVSVFGCISASLSRMNHKLLTFFVCDVFFKKTVFSFGENKVKCSGSLLYWDAADLGIMMHIEIALWPPAL